MKDCSPTGTTPKTDNRYRGAGEADDHVKILYDNAEERQDIRSVRCASRRGAITALHGAGVALAGRTCRRRLGGHRTVMVGVGGEPQAAAKLIAAKIVITRREDLANISMIKGR